MKNACKRERSTQDQQRTKDYNKIKLENEQNKTNDLELGLAENLD